VAQTHTERLRIDADGLAAQPGIAPLASGAPGTPVALDPGMLEEAAEPASRNQTSYHEIGAVIW
jgi:hypothetical protein